MNRVAAHDFGECVNQICPWSGRPVSENGLTRYRGRVVGFSGPQERDRFERAVAMFDAAIGGRPGREG